MLKVEIVMFMFSMPHIFFVISNWEAETLSLTSITSVTPCQHNLESSGLLSIISTASAKYLQSNNMGELEAISYNWQIQENKPSHLTNTRDGKQAQLAWSFISDIWEEWWKRRPIKGNVGESSKNMKKHETLSYKN